MIYKLRCNTIRAACITQRSHSIKNCLYSLNTATTLFAMEDTKSGQPFQKHTFNFQPRPYQVEIVEQAVKQNSIVCLATGTGKTFISAMVIKELYDWKHLPYKELGKRIFFCVNTVPLVEQQSKVIADSTCLTVGKYCGDQNVDDWEKEKWIEEFDKNDVLVMTGQILCDLLYHAKILSRHVGLLVFDECHNAAKHHNYNKILEFFADERQHQPHILGLTASIINEKYKGSVDTASIRSFLLNKMKELESRMKAVLITCADPAITNEFATKPEEIIFPYSSGFSNNGFEDVAALSRTYKEKFIKLMDLYNEERRKLGKEIRRGLQQGYNPNADTTASYNSNSIIHDSMKYVVDVIDTLGPLCAIIAVKILVEQLRKHVYMRSSSIDGSEIGGCINEFENFIDVYTLCIKRASFQTEDDVPPMEPFITTKAHIFLHDVLLANKKYYQEKSNKLHAIVFTERRITAVVLSKLINYQVVNDMGNFEGIWSEPILGHDASSNVKLADCYMKSKDQNKILRRFRNEEFNILVATSVVEEGLDVKKCNVVIRFDGLNNYRAYVQSKGRARAKDSKFIVLAEKKEYNDIKRNLAVMQEIEKILFENCHSRTLPTEIDMQKAFEIEEEIPAYFASGEFDAARITKDNAISLLYSYCAKLPRDAYSTTRPIIFEEESPRDSGMFVARCVLPGNCPLQPRKILGKALLGRDRARQYLCLEICKKLHTIGELSTEHLQPIKHQKSVMEEEDNNGGPKEGTRKNRSFYKRKTPRQLRYEAKFSLSDFDLYAISMDLTEPSDRPKSRPFWSIWYQDNRKLFGMLLPKNGENVAEVVHPINLYIRAGQVTLKLIKLPTTPPQDLNLANLINFHKAVVDGSSPPYVTSDVIFDTDNLLSDKSMPKIIFVPLQSYKMIDTGDEEYCIDFSLIENFDERLQSIPDVGSVIQKTYTTEQAKPKRYYVTGIANQKPSDQIEGMKKTFHQYYLERYNLKISSNQNLFDVIAISSRADYLDPSAGETTKRDNRIVEKLVPEFCEVCSGLTSDLYEQMKCLPFFLYGLENMLNMHNLKMKIVNLLNISHDSYPGLWPAWLSHSAPLEQLANALRLDAKVNLNTASPSLAELWECLTTRQALLGFDLERLEMLGDSFLKAVVTIFLYFKYPHSHESILTTRRMQVISNKNLCRVAKSHRLQNIICNSHFGNTTTESENYNHRTVWLPPGYSRTDDSGSIDDEMGLCFQEVQDKSLADCVEALIGVHLKTGGLNLALHFMQDFLGIDVCYRQIENGSSKVVSNSLSKYSHYPKMGTAMREDNEKNRSDVMSLYNRNKMFNLEKMLKYTFQDKSHLVQAMTHLSYTANFVTGCYQQKEFLGDAILDFLVTLHIYMNKADLSPGDLTHLRSALVNNNTFALLALENKLHKYLLHMSPSLFPENNQFVGLVEEDDIYELLKSPFYIAPRNTTEGFLAPKVLGDVFESIAGAIFLDSGNDLVKVWEVLYPKMERAIDLMMHNVPIHPIRAAMEKHADIKSSDFKFSQNPSDGILCILNYNGKEFKGSGKNKKIAKATCCVKLLQDNI